MADEQTAVADLARPLAQARGLDLVDVVIKGTGGRRLVRVMIDRKGGIELADIQQVSTQLSAALDESDPVEGAYALEVTSPGVDHPLADRAAFDRVEGRAVDVRRTAGHAPQELRGTVVAAEAEVVVLDVEGEQIQVRYRDIEKATQALPW